MKSGGGVGWEGGWAVMSEEEGWGGVGRLGGYERG